MKIAMRLLVLALMLSVVKGTPFSGPGTPPGQLPPVAIAVIL